MNLPRTIEASSLSLISELAASPPLRPDTVHSGPRLELYIVRVPGSRDVFLTPLKPRDRVVNAHDVSSSLYYLHVDDEADDYLFRDEGWERDHSSHGTQFPVDELDRVQSNGFPGVISSSVRRKPLAGPPVWRSREDVVERDPQTVDRRSIVQRKPVLPQRGPPRSGLLSPPLDHDRDPLPRSARSSVTSFSSVQSGRSLTLIRRNPCTGEQTNVAKIHDPPIEDVSSSPALRRKVAGAPMFVTMQTPGCAKFGSADQHCEHDYSKTPLSPPISPTEYQEWPQTSSCPPSPPPSPIRVCSSSSGLCTRRLWLPGSQHADHTYSSAGSATSIANSTTTTRSSPGYAFFDLWGARCDFSTASTGRSLRCRRRAIASQTHLGPNSTSIRMPTDDLSELRFNLPVLHAKSRSESSATPLSTSAIRHGLGISRLSNTIRPRGLSIHGLGTGGTPTQPPDDDDLDVDDVNDDDNNEDIALPRPDYTLARERAGGGFAGREPKLGKLVVHPLGMEMLDLLVAANMALWFRAYERTSCPAGSAF